MQGNQSRAFIKCISLECQLVLSSHMSQARQKMSSKTEEINLKCNYVRLRRTAGYYALLYFKEE
jgi:hypothetical protein